MSTILEVRDLVTKFYTLYGVVHAVNGVSFDLNEGETLAIVGESGSGKSVTMMSILGLIPTPPGRIENGSAVFTTADGSRNLLHLSKEELRDVRGGEIGFVFQDPISTLNPILTIGEQISETLTRHLALTKQQAHERTVKLLASVGIPDPELRYKAYPFQFSGGMRQRVVIAIAIACTPKIIIADEPTTALDVTVQAQIVDLFKRLRKDLDVSIVWITHDLGVVAGIADRVMVLYGGRPAEIATVDDLYEHPQHPYTLGLLGALPRLDSRESRRLASIRGTPPDLLIPLAHCPFAWRCDYALNHCWEEIPPLITVDVHTRQPASTTWREEVRAMSENGMLLRVVDLKKYFPITGGFLGRQVGLVKAVDGISFEIKVGETLGLVGESGCGKSTAGRAILQLHQPTSGQVFLQDTELTSASAEELRALRPRMQMIFQDPYASLNPRHSVGKIVGEPLIIHHVMKRGSAELREKVAELMELVGMEPAYVTRFPHEFSGGQRQRIGIARALALDPSFIVCDEPISALDVSIQAQVVNLMQDLQERLDLAYLFIAHDLSMVKHISHRIAVMYLGRIMELAERNELFDSPLHPYTQSLNSAVPVPNPKLERNRRRFILMGDPPSPANPPSGCVFHTRCPLTVDECIKSVPEFRELRPRHFVACHLADEKGSSKIEADSILASQMD